MGYLALQKKRKSNRGFSLVELIIVIAIMVALIAVMGPQYVKYIQKSRDASIKTAADDVCEFAKTEYASEHLTGTGKIKVFTDDDGFVDLAFETGDLRYKVNLDDEFASGNDAAILFKNACGLSTGRAINTSNYYYVEITSSGSATSIVKTDFEVIPGE